MDFWDFLVALLRKIKAGGLKVKTGSGFHEAWEFFSEEE
jgi:hypothetical protein